MTVIRRLHALAAGIAVIGLAFAAPALPQRCALDTPELSGMEVWDTYLQGPEGERIALKVRVADSNRERAAGFQHLCPEVAEHTSILFVFRRDLVPSFHMQNVHMPLDIAFADAAGVIRSIQTMQPYVVGRKTPTWIWSPGVPVRFALEARAGFYEQAGVTENRWSIVLPPTTR